MATQDPYYNVRDSISEQLRRVQQKHEKFQTMVRSVNTASSTEFRELRKSLIKEFRSVEKQLRDLKLGAVDTVESNRAKFPHITNPELGQRKLFVQESSSILQDIDRAIKSQYVRQKMQDDEKAYQASQTKAMPTKASLGGNDNASFIRNQRQQTHQIIEQQDEALTDLGMAVDRLGDMGRGINQELREQNDMLDAMDDDLDEAGEKMNFVMAKLSQLLKTKDGCMIWTIIILTLILCILIALVVWS